MKKISIKIGAVLLGVSAISVMAAKPVPEPAEITLRAGPTYPVPLCRVSNHTDHPIEVSMAICIALNDNSGPVDCYAVGPNLAPGDPAPVQDWINPGHYQPVWLFKVLETNSYSCEITYKGEPGDITGAACMGTACFPMQ